jgi:hypothetical protein
LDRPFDAGCVLTYLQTDFPQLQLSQLRRDPHLLGWLRCLCEEDPPLSCSTRRIYLVGLRRLLHDFACEGYSLQPGLILSEDFPPPPQSQRKNLTFDPSPLIPGLIAPVPGLGGLPTVTITGFAGFFDQPGSGDRQRDYEVYDNLSWVRGKHSMKFGGTVKVFLHGRHRPRRTQICWCRWSWACLSRWP